jgi:hypothetical protein
MKARLLVTVVLLVTVAGSLLVAYEHHLGRSKAVITENISDAPELVIIGHIFIHLEASSLVNRMPMARYRDPNTGLVEPDDRKMRIIFRLLPDPGTRLPRVLRAQTIWLTQDRHIWMSTDIEATGSAFNRSTRDYQVHDGPNWKSPSPIDFVVRLVDWKGSVYLLAHRQQHILFVE